MPVGERVANRGLISSIFGAVPQPTFEERAPHERGFAPIFARAIGPKLRKLELQRRFTLLVAGLLTSLSSLVAAAGLASAFYFHLGLPPKLFWFVAGGLAAAAGFCVVSFRNREERIFLTGMRDHFHFGKLDVVVNKRTDGSGATPFKGRGLMSTMAPKSGLFGKQLNKEIIKYDDLFTGRRRGIGLWMVEVEDLEQNKRDKDETPVWMGTLIELNLPISLPERLRFNADSAGQWSASPVQDTPAATGGGQSPMPALLTADVLHRLGELYRAFNPQAGNGEADGDAIRISMELRGKARPFQAPGVFQSVYQCEPALRLTLLQIARVFELMDSIADALGLPVQDG